MPKKKLMTITFSGEQEALEKIKEFSKVKCLNFSSKTIDLWLKFIELENKKSKQ